MTERLRVFLVDDHDVARAGARHYLEDRFDIVGEADNAIDATEMVSARKPDLVLLAHGAALSNPEDAQYAIDHTDCHGVQLGSSIERMAVEVPLQERAAAFKKARFPIDARRW